MDQLGEWLVPVVVFVIWAINAAMQMAKKKGEQEEEAEQESRPYTPLDHPANDNNERARRIQEEIRRKIAERRGEAPPPREQADNGPPPLRQPADHRMPSPLEAPRPVSNQREPQHRRQQFPRPNTTSTEPSPYFEVPPPPRNYEAEIEEQRRQAEEALRRAEAVRRQTRAKTPARAPRKPILEHSGDATFKSIRGSLRRDLKDPAAVRRAVLHYEIIGPPVSLRHDDRPGATRGH
ncbi:hypothetical protein H5P28_18865 [Ruficoccus amylovorans]|uniref:Uncharacterized protein n=1 Tax=Ruficoccus amylovorans TaxID=1804625 RepID=A0A842HKX7_9BACT|nr:hypothetical protein [Ruficoccus amylovorans]MBC2596334.1 hypothetical protein [Ruficoccus amylovorans]